MTFYREIEEHRLTVFLGANKYTSFLTYKLFRYFLMQKSVKITIMIILLRHTILIMPFLIFQVIF